MAAMNQLGLSFAEDTKDLILASCWLHAKVGLERQSQPCRIMGSALQNHSSPRRGEQSSGIRVYVVPEPAHDPLDRLDAH